MSTNYGSNEYGSVPPVGELFDESASHAIPVDTTRTSESSGGATSGVKEAAREQASEVGGTAKEAGQKVAGVAKDEASKVASEAKTQVKDLYGQTRSELADQAGAQQQRVASGLHSLSDELSSMANSSDTPGVAADIVHQAATRAGSVAAWLEERDPGSLLSEVREFARKRPGTFIAAAAVAGLLAGRLTRSVVSEARDSGEDADAATAPPVVPADDFDGGIDYEASAYTTVPVSTIADPLAFTASTTPLPQGDQVGTSSYRGEDDLVDESNTGLNR